MEVEDAKKLNPGDSIYCRQYSANFTFKKIIEDYEDLTENRTDYVIETEEGIIVKLEETEPAH